MNCLTVLLALFPLCVSSLTQASTNIYIHTPGKMLPGPFTKGSVKVARNLTLGECAAECSLEYLLNQFSCYAYEYASRERTCLMTNITTLVAKGGYLGLRTNSAMDYYERPKGSYENLFRPYPNQVLERDETYFAVFKNKTLEKCALFCLMETRKPCMSFSYSENKQACGLSSVYYTADNGQTLRRSTEYNHYQYYTTWPCNATIPWNYSPRAIASPYFPYASITDVNCHVIIEASEGKQVDLQFSTFYTKGSLCGENGGISVYDGSTNSAPLMSNLCSSDNFVDRRYQSSTGYLYVQFSTGSIPMAFKGVYDFIEVDMCKMAPCQNGGSCISTSGTYYCDCAAGYTGSKCEANIDECASNPCYLGGQCIDRVNGFECKCPDLLGGPRCDVFVGLCHMKPCQNGAKCSPRGTASYVCACPDGFTGQNCTDRITDPCDLHPCENGAQCVSNTDRKLFECQCLAGFTGSTCETDIDECASSPCLHHFKCHDLVNDYRCDCPPILGGKNCELFLGGCSVRPCVHGQCRPAGATSYTCQCEDGYKGDNCDESFIDFCDPDPCDHGACASSEQGPSCTCDLGYTGFLCDLKIDYCDDVDCHQGECVSLEDDFRCTCLPGYEGRLCNMTINHCKTASCNSGFCINTLTSYFCVCRNGHTGTTCETTPTDECSKTCVNGTCVLRNNTAHCVCDDNFTGTSCDVPIDYCIASPCSHGQCESVPGGYSCTCDENYTGTNCDDVIDDCFKNKCVYGFCQGMENGYRCLCGQGYHGDYCDLKEGETTSSTTLTVPKANVTTQISHGHPQCSRANCRFGVCDQDFTSVCVCYLGYKGSGCEEFVGCDEHNPCNHGNCSDVNGGYGCSCEEGYSGKNCEIDVTDPDPCASVTCQNGGMCYSFNQSDSSMGYQCVCFPGNHGGLCEFSNACLGDVCKNDTCAPIGNGFRCEMTVLSGSSQYPTSVQLVTGGIRSSGRLLMLF